MTIQITLTEAVALLDRAVEEKGSDYKYREGSLGDTKKCRYFDPSDFTTVDDEYGYPKTVPAEDATWTPGCIVGHVLAYKGVKREDLATDLGFIPQGDLNENSGVHELVNGKFLNAGQATVRYLVAAQQCQDGGGTWGQARKLAALELADALSQPHHVEED